MPAPLPSIVASDLARGAVGVRGRARGRVLTPLRRAVLDLLHAADRPIGAYALLEHLRTTHPQAAAPTVYRALAFLLEEGLVHRIERLNAFIAAGEQRAAPGTVQVAGKVQFLICDRCGHTAQLHDATVVDALAQVMDRLGFVARDATIELQGVCATCSVADIPGGSAACHAGP